MKKNLFLFVLLGFSFAAMPRHCPAQDYESPDQYYRAVTTRELDYRLLPATDRFKDQANSFPGFSGTRNRGCPDQINIGGIGKDARIIGSVDINVNIDQDFIINCGNL